MINVYLYNRAPDGLKEKLGADRLFVDFDATNYIDLGQMLAMIGEGDTVLVYDLSDLGKGMRGKRIRTQIEATGASIEIINQDEPKVLRGRPRNQTVTVEAFDEYCSYWYSPASQSYVEDRTGLNRQQLIYLCGKRDGAQKAKKRKALLKRLNPKEDLK